MMAINDLAPGDRRSAADHFRPVLNTKYRYRYVYVYWRSQAFLKRIDDPDWMAWLLDGSAAGMETGNKSDVTTD